jgi:hypothetical protein
LLIREMVCEQAPSVSSINRILRTRAAERAAEELSFILNAQQQSLRAAAAVPPPPPPSLPIHRFAPYPIRAPAMPPPPNFALAAAAAAAGLPIFAPWQGQRLLQYVCMLETLQVSS